MQEPLRLRGDVGHNLDPFGRFEPSVLMKTIVDVGLVQVPKPKTLTTLATLSFYLVAGAW